MYFLNASKRSLHPAWQLALPHWGEFTPQAQGDYLCSLYQCLPSVKKYSVRLRVDDGNFCRQEFCRRFISHCISESGKAEKGGWTPSASPSCQAHYAFSWAYWFLVPRKKTSLASSAEEIVPKAPEPLPSLSMGLLHPKLPAPSLGRKWRLGKRGQGPSSVIFCFLDNTPASRWWPGEQT